MASTKQELISMSHWRSRSTARLRLAAKSLLGLFACFVALATLSLPPLYAQVQNGTISGTITDPAGAVVPDAAVTLTSKATGLVLHVQSSTVGLYSFPQLIPGNYTITVERTGFQKAISTLTLTVGQTAQLNIPLSIGSENETVTVSAENAATLDSETSNLDYTVQSRQVDDLPLNGRNPYGLAILAPGIMPGANFGVGVAVARGAVVAAATNNFESNGGIGGNNEILLDGVSIVVCCQGQPAVTPSVEYVNQAKILTNNPPAQYGRTSGAVLNIATKSGTNSLHGDVYDFLRNDKLDAAPYFTKRSGVYPYPGHKDFRTPHRENQFGVLVTGPVVIPHLYNGRDKTFFTFNYEGIRNFAPTSGLATVPTALMRQGIFTEGPGVIYDPNSATVAGQARKPIPAAICNGAAYAAGYCIPASTWNGVATAYLKYVPSPNLPGTTNNLSYVEDITDNANQYNFRIDHAIGDKHRLFVRGTKDNDTHLNADLFNSFTGPNAWQQPIGAYLFALGDVYQVSPNVVLQFTYGFARQTNYQPGNNVYKYDAADYGFSSTLLGEQQVPGIPVASFTSLGGAQVGWQSSFNHWAHSVHSLNGTMFWQKGKHALTIGYNGKLLLENQFGLGNPNGSLAFGTNFQASTTTGSVSGSQAPFASWATFLQGFPTSGGLQRQLTSAFNQWVNGMYVQDDWKLMSKLTLNLGVRYDIETGFKERHNYWADFDPSAVNPLGVAGGPLFLGVHGNPSRTWETSYHEVSPRLGFSYAATPTTVVRGGFGILFLPTSQRGYSDPNIGYSQSTSLPTSSTGYTPAVTTDNPFPTGVLLPSGPAGGEGIGNGSTLSGFLYKNPPSYQEQWNFGIEQAMGNTFTLQINYAGGHGVHLPFNGYRPNDLRPQFFGPIGAISGPNTNPATVAAYNALNAQVANPYYGKVTSPGSTYLKPTVQQVQLDALYNQYTPGAVTGIQNGSLGISYQDIGSTTYNSLQSTVLIHRPGGGVSGSVSYVWSKLLGNVSDITNGFLNTTGNPGVQDFYFLNMERSTLATDIRDRVVGTATWDIPVGRGKKYGGNIPGWANQVVGGWELTTLIDVYSGFPLSPTVTGTGPFAGTRPMIVPGINPQTTGGYEHRLGGAYGQTQGYLNPAAFATPLTFQLGNAPRSWAAARGPINFDDNASAIKRFPIHDQIGLEFRAEAFNLLNKVNFGMPNGQLNSSTFGQITSQYNLPRNVQLAVKLHF